MYDNIYGGIQSPGWYQFDKIIYGSANEGLDPTDEIMLGRYILICYCGTAFTEEQKKLIENSDGTDLSTEEKIYWDCYNADNKISKDRMIYKKIYIGNEIQYIEIGRVNDVAINDARIKIITWEEDE